MMLTQCNASERKKNNKFRVHAISPAFRLKQIFIDLPKNDFQCAMFIMVQLQGLKNFGMVSKAFF